MGVFRRTKAIALFLIAFALGYAVAHAALNFQGALQAPSYSEGQQLPALIYSSFTGSAIPRASPADRLAESDIIVHRDRVELDVQDAILAKFTATNSMDPVLDETANALEIKPKNSDDVHEGDIIAYTPQEGSGTIIHRVIKRGEDSLGTYYIVQGDNNPTADPQKIRYEDVKSVVVAIIY